MKPSATPRTDLVRRQAHIEPWRDPDWQKLWLSLRSQQWSSLAVVPAAVGGPPHFALTVAVTLARVGTTHLGTPVHVADATNVSLVHLEQVLGEIRRVKQEGESVLVALSAASENPVTVALAKGTDVALLCVLYEQMLLAESRRTVDRIGVAKFAGSVTFRDAPPFPT